MALLAPFQKGKEAIIPEVLKARLRNFSLLDGVGEPALRRLLAEADWFSLPGGTQLFREGENDRAVFLVVTGSLGVFVDDEEGPQRLAALIPAGETVGEMSLLTGESHSASVVALRDTELLRLGPEAFDMLLTRYPRVMLNLLKITVNRLRRTTRRATHQVRPKTFAVVALQQGLEVGGLARSLAKTLAETGARTAVLDSHSDDESTDWFNQFEAEHDIIFYVGDGSDTPWSYFCVRQADRILLVARADKRLPLHNFESRLFKHKLFKHKRGAPPELILLHPAGNFSGFPDHMALKSDLYGTHYHLREDYPEDMKRLARFISGSAVNIVLAGGGARAMAHIGVLKALKEVGVPFDYVAGTSMGGLIAAGIAMEWDLEELTERVKAAFVDVNPLSDFTLPLIALFRGKKVSALLRHHFGDTRIEDLLRPYFCVSSDITAGRDYVHRSGLVWRTLRASVALPGLLPPVVVEKGHLLVDGGVMNNLPVDIMADETRGPIIAVDVSGEIDLRAYDPRYGERSIWSLIGERMRGSPSIISILMRSGTVGSDAQRRIVREQADFLFAPPLEDIGMRDWKAFERAIAQGYAHAMLEIEKHGVPLTDFWASGPAVSINRQST